MKTSTLSASIFAAAAFCTGASATTVDLQYVGMGANEIVNILASPGYIGLAYCGQIQISATNSSNPANFANGNYLMYCADLYQDSNPAVNPYTVVALPTIPTTIPMGAAAANAIRDIYFVAAGAQYGGFSDLACAFQLAIWEIVTDGLGGGLGSGLFQATGESASALAYYNGLMSIAGSGVGANTNLIGLASPDFQDYISEDQGNVPAPGALALIGLSGLVSSRRRRA